MVDLGAVLSESDCLFLASRSPKPISPERFLDIVGSSGKKMALKVVEQDNVFEELIEQESFIAEISPYLHFLGISPRVLSKSGIKSDDASLHLSELLARFVSEKSQNLSTISPYRMK